MPDKGMKKDCDEGKAEVEKKPIINIFQTCSRRRETVVYRDVEGRENHHAGQIGHDYGVKLVFNIPEVVCSLVDDVQKQGGKICSHESSKNVSFEVQD